MPASGPLASSRMSSGGKSVRPPLGFIGHRRLRLLELWDIDYECEDCGVDCLWLMTAHLCWEVTWGHQVQGIQGI